VHKEAYLLATPCPTTAVGNEWLETLDGCWNVLVTGELADLGSVVLRPRPQEPVRAPYGDARATEAVVAALTAGAPPTGK
jgi:UDP-N-acetylglucosamine 2-epimerase (non-hydrolysing)